MDEGRLVCGGDQCGETLVDGEFEYFYRTHEFCTVYSELIIFNWFGKLNLF